MINLKLTEKEVEYLYKSLFRIKRLDEGFNELENKDLTLRLIRRIDRTIKDEKRSL